MIRAVIFDMDGTLTDTIEDLADAANYALGKFGFPQHNTESYKMMVGNGIPKLIERALPEEFRTDEYIGKVKERFFEYYNLHSTDKTKKYEGMTELISELREKGIKIAVVTNKYEPAAIDILHKLYGDVFDCIAGQLDGVPTKPDPTSTFIVMNKLGVKPEECIFIGDSGVDIQTAVNSKALPIGVLWGFRGESELKENGAKHLINRPEQLLRFIK